MQSETHALGADHLHVATTMANLGELHQKLKEFKEAKKLYESALQIKVKVLGERNYAIGKIYYKLAELEREEENKKKAKEYYEMAISILNETLGSNHPYFVKISQNKSNFEILENITST
jgi:tetratricopeptide (TPR) repeat protein